MGRARTGRGELRSARCGCGCGCAGGFTELQGQYLAFIYRYSVLNRRPPAAADLQAFFGVTPPTVHRMVLELERRGFIQRTPRQSRSIELCVPVEEIPWLLPQSIVTTVSRC